MTRERSMQIISIMAVVCLLVLNIYPLYTGVFGYISTSTGHTAQYALGLAMILFVCIIPLLYDIFRNTKVMFLVFLVSVILFVSALYIYSGYIHILNTDNVFHYSAIVNLLIIMFVSILLPLFSTVWHRYAHIWYGILTSAALLCFSYFIYVLLIGHFIDNLFSFVTGTDILQVALIFPAICWAVVRSWNPGTFIPCDPQEGGK